MTDPATTDRLVEDFVAGRLSRRGLVRRLVGAGVSLDAAKAHASVLRPRAAGARPAPDHYGGVDHYGDVYPRDLYESPADALPRPRYFPRQLVTAADLTAEQDYLSERLRRHNRMLHGAGVVCGLDVGLREGGLLGLGSGAAIVPRGDEAVVGRDVVVAPAALEVLLVGGERRRVAWPPPAGDPCDGDEHADQRLYLAIGASQERTDPRPSLDGELCGGTTICEPARLRDGYELVVLDAITVADAVERVPPADDRDWRAEFFNYDPSPAPPAFPDTEPDAVLHFDAVDAEWGGGSPTSAVNADFFLSRWRRRVNLAAGRYRFTTLSDDGVRVRVDGRIVIDKWQPMSLTASTGDIVVGPGLHELELDYFERTGQSRLRLDWQALDLGWRAEIWPLTGAGGPPAFSDPAPLERVDPGIAFEGQLGAGISAKLLKDGVALRWTRELDVADAGEYELLARIDGGVRVYVDGQIAIDAWPQQPARVLRGRAMLSAGRHVLRVEYRYANGSTPVAKLDWERVGPYRDGCEHWPEGGFVVLAALLVRGSQVTAVDDLWFNRGAGLRRRLVPSAHRLARSREPQPAPPAPGAIAQIVPAEGRRGTTVEAVILGRRLAGARAAAFTGAGVSGTVLPGGGDDWLAVRITIDSAAALGKRVFTLTTPACAVESEPFGIGFDVVDAPSTLPTLTLATFLPTVTALVPITLRPITLAATRFVTNAPDTGDRDVLDIAGPVFGHRLRIAGITRLSQLAESEPRVVAEAINSSEVRAMALIDGARSAIGT